MIDYNQAIVVSTDIEARSKERGLGMRLKCLVFGSSRSQGQLIQSTSSTHSDREQLTSWEQFSVCWWMPVQIFCSAHQNHRCSMCASRLWDCCYRIQFRGKMCMDLPPWAQTEVRISPESFQCSLQCKWWRDATLASSSTLVGWIPVICYHAVSRHKNAHINHTGCAYTCVISPHFIHCLILVYSVHTFKCIPHLSIFD